MQMVLTKKGVWDFLGELPMIGDERQWRRGQQLGLTEIHLVCEPEQKQLISEAVDMTPKDYLPVVTAMTTRPGNLMVGRCRVEL